MAEAYVKAYGCSLELDVSEFALVFALFNDLLKKENSGLLTPGITELKDRHFALYDHALLFGLKSPR